MGRRKREEYNFEDVIEKNFSNYVTKFGEDTKNEIAGVISTGVPSLDISIGIGGIPLGRCTEIFGKESSGKTTLALNVTRNALLNGYNVLYVDSEQGLDEYFTRSIIGDLIYDDERFTLFQPKTMEESLGICEAGIKSGNFNVVILDSIGAMAPHKVQVKDLEDDTMGLLAKRLTIFLQRNAFDIRYGNIAFIGLNQVRDKLGMFTGGGFETPGGHNWKHIASLRIELKKMEDIKVVNEIIGIQTRFTIRKSKVGKPFRSFYFPILFEGGVDKSMDMLEFGLMTGDITRKGPFYYFDELNLGQGRDASTEFLKENPDTLDKIYESCYNSINGGKISLDTEVIDAEDVEG